MVGVQDINFRYEENIKRNKKKIIHETFAGLFDFNK